MKFLGLKRAEQIVQLFLLLNTNFTCKHFLLLGGIVPPLPLTIPVKLESRKLSPLQREAGNRIDMKVEMKGFLGVNCVSSAAFQHPCASDSCSHGTAVLPAVTECPAEREFGVKY